MRTLTMILLFFFGQLLYAQDDTTRRFAISFEGNRPISFGNNFMSKAYNDKVGFAGTLQVNIKKIFVEFTFEQNYIAIVDPSLIGNFSSSSGDAFSVNIGYRQFLQNPKIFLEYKIGYGDRRIHNYSGIADYSTTGTDYLVGARLHYKIYKNLSIYTNIDFHYTDFEVNDIGPYKSFYENGYQIIPSIGMKLPFGRSQRSRIGRKIKK